MTQGDLLESDERRPGVVRLVVRPPDAEQTRQTDEVLLRVVQRLRAPMEREEKTNEVTLRQNREGGERNRRLISRADRSPPLARARLIRFRRRRATRADSDAGEKRPARAERPRDKSLKVKRKTRAASIVCPAATVDSLAFLARRSLSTIDRTARNGSPALLLLRKLRPVKFAERVLRIHLTLEFARNSSPPIRIAPEFPSISPPALLSPLGILARFALPSNFQALTLPAATFAPPRRTNANVARTREQLQWDTLRALYRRVKSRQNVPVRR